MEQASLHIYKIARSIIVTMLLAFLIVYTALYVVLSVPAVQNKIRTTAEEELSKFLKTNVTIGKIEINPLSELALYDVRIPDQQGGKMVTVDKIGAGMSLPNLVFFQRFVFNYAELIGLDGRITKATPDSQMNIQFIIDALKPKDKNKPPTKFDVKLDAVVLRKSSLSFDVLSEPVGSGKFDKNHIRLQNINSDIRIPDLRNDYFTFDIRRFAFSEHSGFHLNNLTALVHIDKRNITAKRLKIELPGTRIEPADISLHFNDLKTLGKEIKQIPLSLKIEEAPITLSDFKAFVPELGKVTMPMFLTIDVNGTASRINLRRLNIHTDGEWLAVNTSASVTNPTDKRLISIDIPSIKMTTHTTDAASWLERGGMLKHNVADLLARMSFIAVDGSFTYHQEKAKYIGSIKTGLGQLNTNGVLTTGERKNFTGRLSSDNLHLASLLPDNKLLGNAAFDVNTNMDLSNGKPIGTVKGVVKYIDLKGYRYNDITADLTLKHDTYLGSVKINDPNAFVDIAGTATIKGKDSKFDIKATLADINFYNLHLINKNPDHKFRLNLDASFSGNSPDNMEGDIMISDIKFNDDNGQGVDIDHFDISARNAEGSRRILTVNSDLVNGTVDGDINFADIAAEVRTILGESFPSLITSDAYKKYRRKSDVENKFNYHFTFAENNELTEFFKLPITIVHPIELTGRVDTPNKNLTLGLNAPYIIQKKKVIEGTNLALSVDNRTKMTTLNLSTKLDNKNGDIILLLNGLAANDRLDTDVEWVYDRKKDFSGKVSLSTLLRRQEDTKQLEADININPSKFVVNDTVWDIDDSRIRITADKKIHVDNINVNRDGQFVKAHGTVSALDSDSLLLQLRNIDLEYVFETLHINHVVFGGRATGNFYASSLLSKSPKLHTPDLHVNNFSYHHAPLGDADIESHWDNDTKGIYINADIHQKNQRTTFVRGAVYPTRDSLDFKFDADHVNVQIIKPFMAAFSSDVEGEATGHAELYGTFKLINMKGRLFADRFRLKIDQTNTYYSVSDSIIMDPGIIRVKNATVRDDYGNTALINGSITHTYFKEANFKFAVTNVNNMLCYNTTSKDNPRWYGRVFGNGSAFIVGKPGDVRIDVNMSAAPKSSFTFVVSDQEEAGEYTFVTFTDRRKAERQAAEDAQKPDFLKRQYNNDNKNNLKTAFHINLLVDANPNIALTLVMDPEGGDRIRATGNGNMRIEYDSADGMKMFGNYTAEEGRYNFTLQDIIVREFRLKSGSSISFHGDPMAASLDIAATYSVNANLTDLDESFANDKDLNRTQVPVNALLKLTGAMSQPDISFDLEFPTLTQDVYRKVRSIINTDDMMTQQMIYLLALNRFYTPEYMAATNRNNELAAVASSTLSSQLSSVLGQLSDNWTIAPNIYSSKGDFSDTQVELALSSHLLNNRLLLNGNFGYSDNSMNSNSFIGDFDVEYLLTKNGNFRLKAYNRCNDQNYYIRNALTTQSVGIMFKHDFNNLFHKKSKPEKQKKDTVPERRNDSIPPKRNPVPVK